eukprot:6501185-Prymnesium_polylepis.1
MARPREFVSWPVRERVKHMHTEHMHMHTEHMHTEHMHMHMHMLMHMHMYMCSRREVLTCASVVLYAEL